MNHPRPEVQLDTTWTFPTPEIAALDNGIEVWFYPMPHQHVVHGALLLEAPLAIAEPEDLPGVASVTADAILDQTQDHSHEALVELLADHGATVSASVTRTHSVVSFSVSARRLLSLLPIVSSMVRRPVYRQSDIQRHRLLEIADLEQLYARNSGIASVATRRVLYAAGSRDQIPLGGTTTSLHHVDATAADHYHHQWWTPDHATLVLAGAVPANLVTALNENFGDWANSSTQPPDYVPTYSDQPQIWVVDRPDAVQADIRLAMPGPGRQHELWPALTVASCAIGGSFNSRLNSVLREELGYTYGAHAGFRSERGGGRFTVQTSCRNDVASDAILQCLRLLRLEDDPLTADEVINARNYVLGTAPLHFDTAAAVISQASTLVTGDLRPEWFNDHRSRITELSTDDANSAFLSTVTPEKLSIVVSGVATELVPGLQLVGLEPTVVEFQP